MFHNRSWSSTVNIIGDFRKQKYAEELCFGVMNIHPVAMFDHPRDVWHNHEGPRIQKDTRVVYGILCLPTEEARGCYW